ncbi:MAG: hypothetical protein L0221_05155, partial [Chloroflexi bacterium]|nr:hypothetical protein [Chloroflexota bacterium]
MAALLVAIGMLAAACGGAAAPADNPSGGGNGGGGGTNQDPVARPTSQPGNGVGPAAAVRDDAKIVRTG